jgi:ribosomal-protein-alanine N-acetyltransferase
VATDGDADCEVLIRPAHSAELGELAAVEQAAHAHPWSASQLAQSLRDDMVLVLQQDVRIVAFSVLQTVLDEATLLDIAVLPECRRRGFARRLLQHAFAALRERGCRRCFLEVRASNAAAIALYRHMGFVFDGVRRNYYPAASGAREDAHLFHADW